LGERILLILGVQSKDWVFSRGGYL
jgi:hypothetical protein